MPIKFLLSSLQAQPVVPLPIKGSRITAFLFEYLIKTYSDEADLIMDCVVGSGTTAIASLNTKRNFICNDNNLEYCDIANKRIEEVKQKAMQSEARHSSQA